MAIGADVLAMLCPTGGWIITENNFASYLIIGAMVLLFAQSFINIGMNIGLLPVTGLPLPFISYGGSSLVSAFILIGICQSVALRSR